MAGQVIATVLNVTGNVMVRSADGTVRALKVGDEIRTGDTVLNQGGRIELISINGEVLGLVQAPEVAITDELFASTAPTPTQAVAANQTLDPILQTLAQGGDLNELLEATAAGADAGGGGGGGTSFVVLQDENVSTTGIGELDRASAGTEETTIQQDAIPPATVVPTIIQNVAPNAANDALTTAEDTSLTISPATLLANDTDPDGDTLTISSVQGAVNGTVSLDPNGNVIFTPTANYNGAASFTYTVTDGKGGSATATVNVSVTPVNDTPIANDDPATNATGYSVSIGAISGIDSWTNQDSNGQTVTVTAYKVDGTIGTVGIGSDLKLGVANDARNSGQVTPKIEFNDQTQQSEAAVFSFSGQLNTATVTLANLFTENGTAEVAQWTAMYDGAIVATGTVTGISSGAPSFTIDTGSKVFNQIKFEALEYADNKSATGDRDSSDFFVHAITGSGPAIANGVYVVDEEAILTVSASNSLLKNDTDIEGDALSVTHVVVNGVSHSITAAGTSIILDKGELVIKADGTFTFTPNAATQLRMNAGDVETQSFTYTIQDVHGNSLVDGSATDSQAIATITIIGKENDLQPVAQDETVTLEVGTTSTNLLLTLDVSGSMDNESNNSPTRFDIAKASLISLIQSYQAMGATEVNLTLFASGAKNVGWMSADATIGYLNALTVHYDDRGFSNGVYYNNTNLNIGTSTDYKDGLDATRSISFSGHAADQTVAYFLSDGEPTENATSVDADSDTTIQNWKSFVDANVDALYVVGIGGNVSTNYLNIVQVESDKSTILVTNESQLSATLTNTATMSVSGTVSDNVSGGDGNLSFASITLNGVTYTPNGANGTTAFPADGVALGGKGKLVFNFTTGEYTYTVGANEFIADDQRSFDVMVKDADGDTDSLTVTIVVNHTSGQNTAPTSAGDSISTLEDTAYTLTLADFGYADANGDAMSSVRIVSLPTNGKLTLNGADVVAGSEISVANITSGKLMFVPTANTDNDASFTIQVSDGQAWSDNATVNVSVTAVADAPSLTATITTGANVGVSHEPLAFIYGGTSLLGLADVSALNALDLADGQMFAAHDADNDITSVTLTSNNGLLGGLLGGITGQAQFNLPVAGLPNGVVLTGNNSTLLTIAKQGGGTFTNDEINDILAQVSIYKTGLLPTLLNTSVDLLNAVSIRVTDSLNQTASKTDYDLVDVDLLNNATSGSAIDVGGTTPSGTSSSATYRYSINLDAALTDRDGSESLTLVISGLPAGASIEGAVQNTNGTWTVSVAPNALDFDGSLTLVVPDSVTTDFDLVVIATSTEANGGDTESVSTTLRVDLPQQTTVNHAPDVQASGEALLGIVGIDLFNFLNLDSQALTAVDVDNNLKSVTIQTGGLVDLRLGATAKPIVVDEALAASLGLKVTGMDTGLTLLGLITVLGGYKLTIEALNGGSISNEAINKLLATVAFDNALISAGVLSTTTIKAVDTTNLSDTATIGTLADVNVFGDTTGQNNGYGNGDQNAPGSSLPNNNAENSDNKTIGTGTADNLQGSGVNDNIYGKNGNDNLRGGAGDDVIYGEAGDDTITGQSGNDTLVGGLGADVFRWELNDQGSIPTPTVDVVKDFNSGAGTYQANEGDKLDLADLLVGEAKGTDIGNLLNYLHVDVNSAGDTVVNISSQGQFTNGQFDVAKVDQSIVLENVSLADLGFNSSATQADMIQQLLQQGKLITD